MHSNENCSTQNPHPRVIHIFLQLCKFVIHVYHSSKEATSTRNMNMRGKVKLKLQKRHDLLCMVGKQAIRCATAKRRLQLFLPRKHLADIPPCCGRGTNLRATGSYALNAIRSCGNCTPWPPLMRQLRATGKSIRHDVAHPWPHASRQRDCIDCVRPSGWMDPHGPQLRLSQAKHAVAKICLERKQSLPQKKVDAGGCT